MTYYAVSQIVELIQENLHDPEYYDIHKYSIEPKLRKLIQQENPKRYPPVTKLSKYSLDEDFKNKAIQLLTDFERLRIPTEAELLIKELEPEMLEDGTTWFKLSKLYNALDGRGTIPDDMSDRKFWTNAHKRLEQFEHIYIKTINPYTKYPNVAVIHYKVMDLKNILNCLNTEGIIHAEQLIEKLQ
jgi:hypothetical protein